MFTKEQTTNLKCVLNTYRYNDKNVPVWYMRQAGRYLPEYQELMKPISNFLKACYSQEIVVEATLQPIKRFDLDAAIIFSDIMTVPDALGYEVSFLRGYGPKISREKKEKNLSPEESLEKVMPVLQSIYQVRQLLDKRKSLIGFAGSPWTLATYILGKDKRTSDLVCMHRSGDNTVMSLINELTCFTATYLKKQIDYGADVIQLFESNATGLPVDLFREFVIKPTEKIISVITKHNPSVPVIGFPKGAGILLKEYSERTGVKATSIDYSTPISWIKDNITGAVQGNLDPSLIAHDIDTAILRTTEIISSLKDKPLIFNLGHGMLPSTPVDNVKRLTDFVHNFEI